MRLATRPPGGHPRARLRAGLHAGHRGCQELDLSRLDEVGYLRAGAAVRSSADVRPADHAHALTAGPFRLRAFSLADIEVVREASADPHIPLITTVPRKFTHEEGRRFIERQWSRAEQGAGYSSAVTDAGTGQAAGQIGLWVRDISEGRASIGYWIISTARGRRAATHALRALAHWGLSELKISRLELQVEPWNTASLTTAERSGFQREGLLRSWQEVSRHAPGHVPVLTPAERPVAIWLVSAIGHNAALLPYPRSDRSSTNR